MMRKEVGVAEMPPHPRNAIELLTPREGRIEPIINVYWPAGLGTVAGFICGIGSNLMYRRPWTAGMHYSILTAVGLGAIFHYIGLKRVLYMNERDAVLKHYIELHPEDFILPERKKYGEVLEKWIPAR